MVIRQVTINDTAKLYHMMNVLDDETDYMLYEPGERKLRPKTLDRLAQTVESAASGMSVGKGHVAEATAA